MQVLLRVAEGELALADRPRLAVVRLALRQVAEVHDAVLEPLAVGRPGRDLALDVLVGDDPARLEVD